MNILRPVALAMVAGAGFSCAARPRVQPSLRWVADPASPTRATVEAKVFDPPTFRYDIPAESRLRVYARPAAHAAGYPYAMLGTYQVTGRVLRFRPAYPLEPGVRYEAVLNLRSGMGDSRMLDRVLTASYTPPPRPETQPTVASRVYPTAGTVPENLLKFYVRFSAPMSRGGVYRHVRLIDESGREVELPFLELEEELWDPEMTRLTLFIDPGRIKRGVRPLEEIGPALEQGRRYTLVIDRGLVDAAGRELAGEFRKSFAVGPPDREAPDPVKWTVTPPRGSTREPLTVAFSDPMDHALAERLIRVEGGGRVVPGVASVGGGELRWTFTPDRPWDAGRYDIVVQPTVEDLAGNNVGKLFEMDVQADSGGTPAMAPVRLPLQVR